MIVFLCFEKSRKKFFLKTDLFWSPEQISILTPKEKKSFGVVLTKSILFYETFKELDLFNVKNWKKHPGPENIFLISKRPMIGRHTGVRRSSNENVIISMRIFQFSMKIKDFLINPK